MKKIINGTRYDTDKATCIGYTQNGYQGDFQYFHEELYVTQRSDKYFIHGEGGPMSRWSKPTGDGNIGGGDGILPLSKASALEWAEHNLDSDTVEKYFGDMIEDA